MMDLIQWYIQTEQGWKSSYMVVPLVYGCPSLLKCLLISFCQCCYWILAVVPADLGVLGRLES